MLNNGVLKRHLYVVSESKACPFRRLRATRRGSFMYCGHWVKIQKEDEQYGFNHPLLCNMGTYPDDCPLRSEAMIIVAAENEKEIRANWKGLE